MSPIVSGGTAAAGGSGFLFIDTITAPVNIAGTSQGTATTIITCAAHTFDGGQVMLTVYTPQLYLGTGGTNSANVNVLEGATQLAVMGVFVGPASGLSSAYVCTYVFTPTAASHTYTIKAWVANTTGTPSWSAGTGGTGASSYPPSYALFTKAA